MATQTCGTGTHGAHAEIRWAQAEIQYGGPRRKFNTVGSGGNSIRWAQAEMALRRKYDGFRQIGVRF
eukprot:365432-Chlamydomonas_euryale.AAC.2